MIVGVNPDAFERVLSYKEKADRLEKAMLEIYRWKYYAQPHDETELSEREQGYDDCLVNVKIAIEEALGLDGE